MPNEENLKKGKATQFRSGEEAAKAGRKGGIASGVSRSFRSAVKKRIKEHPELIQDALDMLEGRMLDGDLKAFELFLELSGESAKQMEITLKKQELKLKKDMLQTGAAGEAELPQLFAALQTEDGEADE